MKVLTAKIDFVHKSDHIGELLSMIHSIIKRFPFCYIVGSNCIELI